MPDPSSVSDHHPNLLSDPDPDSMPYLFAYPSYNYSPNYVSDVPYATSVPFRMELRWDQLCFGRHKLGLFVSY
jgi:hypothetical protein